MSDQMTDELNRAVEDGMSITRPQRQVPRAAVQGMLGTKPAPMADMLSAVAQHNEMLKSHLDTCIHALEELRSKL